MAIIIVKSKNISSRDVQYNNIYYVDIPIYIRDEDAEEDYMVMLLLLLLMMMMMMMICVLRYIISRIVYVTIVCGKDDGVTKNMARHNIFFPSRRRQSIYISIILSV